MCMDSSVQKDSPACPDQAAVGPGPASCLPEAETLEALFILRWLLELYYVLGAGLSVGDFVRSKTSPLPAAAQSSRT